MHYIDKARQYKKILEENNITAYEYARKLGKNSATISNFTRILRFNDEILKEIKESNINRENALRFLKLIGKTSDRRIITMIRFVGKKKARLSMIEKFIEYEISKNSDK